MASYTSNSCNVAPNPFIDIQLEILAISLQLVLLKKINSTLICVFHIQSHRIIHVAYNSAVFMDGLRQFKVAIHC